MYIKREIELVNFEFWGSAKAVTERMTNAELNAIDEWLEESYGENIPEDIEINDFFWFDEDCWLEIINETADNFYDRPLATQYGYKHWPNKATMIEVTKKGA